MTERAEMTDLAEEREVRLPRWAESRNACGILGLVWKDYHLCEHDQLSMDKMEL